MSSSPSHGTPQTSASMCIADDTALYNMTEPSSFFPLLKNVSASSRYVLSAVEERISQFEVAVDGLRVFLRHANLLPRLGEPHCISIGPEVGDTDLMINDN